MHQQSLSIVDMATIIAILAGPVLGVLFTRWTDDLRFNRERRMSVFRDLMRTRRLRLNPAHVSALNLVEIEFYGEPQVILAWKNYLAHLSIALSEVTDSEVLKKHFDEQDKLLAKLLYSMSKLVGYGEIEQFEILDGGYSPQGWALIEGQYHSVVFLLLEVLQGKRALPITPVVAPSASAPFPPPPAPTNVDGDVAVVKLVAPSHTPQK